MVAQAEKNNDITPSQCGGRHGKQAQSAVLNKVLIFDITRHLFKPLISVDEDLKANYDRELAHLGAMEDRYVGLTHEHGEYLVRTTREQQFFVKTGFGSDPWRSLGYFINPTGTQDELFKCAQAYVTEWCSRIRTSKLFPNEIILSYFTVLVPQVTYRLAASSFTYEQCDSLMRRIYPILLNAYGFHRHFSRVMASAPFRYGGLNITHFYDIQGQQKVKFFAMHLKRGDDTGNLISIALQHMQLSVGTEKHFFHQPFATYQHLLPHSWLKQLLEYLDSRQIAIDLTQIQTLRPQRKYDKSIMDVIKPYFTTAEQILINRMRIHLKLYYISDMVGMDGRRVLQNIKQHVSY